MKNKVVNSIIEFITVTLGYPVELNETSKLADDAGLDSLDALDMLGYIEREYDVEIDNSELAILKEPIGHIADFICNRLKNGS